MAKGVKSGGKDFSKGVTGNPNGRPKLPEDIKQARALTKIEFERIVNKQLGMTKRELSDYMDRPETTALEHMVGSIVRAGIELGDHQRMNFILDRMIGKVVDKMETHNVHQHYVEQLTTEELLEQGREALKLLESQIKP